MEYNIREARKEDMRDVLDLIRELAAYENHLDDVEVSVKDLEEEGFEHGNFKCFVAEVSGKIEGMALVYFRFSTWKGRTVHLEDLIVRESMRGTGLGGALYQSVVKYGHDNGVKRIEWVVSEGNKNAIEFYENTGAQIKESWKTVHMEEGGIQKNVNK
ncbi:GNAT family N-acetyltransferase [Christiangramia salexigens]|uniref:GNAT family N-acetyltransferase n=1 Tax=Christiangramia salexigens TaxID=1913577 RepID=A0A1L3J668_9FLAO|nr:GNAT family N-acetyltransferase [Christiangramia salexigens]APG60621.1 GNAT family N-acetyltransferase [Christiangramia salexigens]